MTASPSTAPRSIRLQVWLPLALLIVCALVFFLLTLLEHWHAQQDLQRFSQRTAHAQLLSARRALETVLRRGDGSGTDAIVADLGLSPMVNYAVLLDDNDQVLAATQFAWKGLPAKQALPHQALALETVSTKPGQAHLHLDIEGLQLHAISPVAMPLRSNELRTNRYGSLLIEYDLAPLVAQSSAHTRAQWLMFLLITSIAAILLLSLARRFILRPVAALDAAMRTIGQGKLQIAAPLAGTGELFQLGQSLQHMAQTLHASQAALSTSEARFHQLADATLEAIFFHEQGTILDVNSRAEQLLGRPAQQLIGADIFTLVSPEYRPLIRQRATAGATGVWDVSFLSVDGTPIPCEVTAMQREVDGRTVRTVVARDIRPRLQAEAKIRQLAHFDTLTGLPNRRQIFDHIHLELQEVERNPNRRSALATFNLDNFKAINDAFGMAFGDTALRTLAQRLSSQQVQHQFFARIHSDTFALLLTNLSGTLEQASAQAASSIENVLAQIAQPLQVHQQTLHLSAGAGVVMIPNDSQDPPELLREAETAMHLSKAAGDNRVRFFAHALQEAASARLALRNDLKAALHITAPAPQELLLHYQPQINAQGQLHGVEALVRWNHPQQGLIPPGAFIAEAEASGLIVPLGNWVLLEAAAALRRWQTESGHATWAQPLTMAVNVSPRQFREPDFVDRVCATLEQLGLNALSLELELTESVVADDLEATLAKMQLLRQYGVRFALDDFGTGYSSLSYLKHLPIDTLKIDRSFVMDIDAQAPTTPGGKRPAVLIEAIIAMAHQLNMRVLAEGVETPAQLAHLKASGCDIFQGYFFSKPLPEGLLLPWASQRSQEHAP